MNIGEFGGAFIPVQVIHSAARVTNADISLKHTRMVDQLVQNGINDLWRAHSNQINESVGIEEYEITYQQLLSRLKEQSQCQLVLMEPFMFCDDTANPMLKDLCAYIDVVHRMAERFDAVLVPLQQAIDRKIKQVTSDKWSDDTVHPFTWAHAWISQQWIEATKV